MSTRLLDNPNPGPTPSVKLALRASVVVLALGMAVLAYSLLLPNSSQLSFTLLGQVLRQWLPALIAICVPGIAMARFCTPKAISGLWPLMILPFGLLVGALLLTLLQIIGASPRIATGIVTVVMGLVGLASLIRPSPKIDWSGLISIGAAGLFVAAVVLIPVFTTGQLTVFGQNPDAHQVIGVVWMLQEASPLGVHANTAIDQIPPAWSGRIPIFPPLGAAVELAGSSPYAAFTPFVSILTATAAIGMGLFGGVAFRLRPPLIALVVVICGISSALIWVPLHPYYNQLWGMVLLAWIVCLVWLWLRDGDLRAAIGVGALMCLVASAYPTALAYAVGGAVVIIAVLGVPQGWQDSSRKVLKRWWPALAVVGVGAAVLVVPFAWSKISGIGKQFFGQEPFWQGDVWSFAPVGESFGLSGGGLVVAIAIALVGTAGLALLRPRAAAIWFGFCAVLLAVDARLRVLDGAFYVEYKHLIFVAMLLVPIAVAGVFYALSDRLGLPSGLEGSPLEEITFETEELEVDGDARAQHGARILLASTLAVVGTVGLALFVGGSLLHTRKVVAKTDVNLKPEMIQLLGWAKDPKLAPNGPVKGSSILLDLPSGGVQLWSILMLGRDHQLSVTEQVGGSTTYLSPPLGRRARFVLGLKLDLRTGKPVQKPRYAFGDPVLENDQFAIWKMRITASERKKLPATSSFVLGSPISVPGAEARGAGHTNVSPGLPY